MTNQEFEIEKTKRMEALCLAIGTMTIAVDNFEYHNPGLQNAQTRSLNQRQELIEMLADERARLYDGGFSFRECCVKTAITAHVEVGVPWNCSTCGLWFDVRPSTVIEMANRAASKAK